MMPRAIPISPYVDAAAARLGWRAGSEAEETAEAAALLALKGQPPRRKVTAVAVLASIARDGDARPQRPAADIVPADNPCAEGLARAARNGDAIAPEIEQRMREDKARARAARTTRPPKS
jgi:hypothetical protein